MGEVCLEWEFPDRAVAWRHGENKDLQSKKSYGINMTEREQLAGLMGRIQMSMGVFLEMCFTENVQDVGGKRRGSQCWSLTNVSLHKLKTFSRCTLLSLKLKIFLGALTDT